MHTNPNEQLSQDFTLGELTHTNTGIPNWPDDAHYAILKAHLAPFLEKIRTRALDNKPIIVHSAYRSPRVNRAVGGVSNSAHLSAYAADIECPQFGDCYTVAVAIQTAGKAGLIVYDQLIYEQTWVHVSCAPAARMEDLTHYDDGSYVDGLQRD